MDTIQSQRQGPSFQPGDESALADFLRGCSESRVPVVLRGGGSKARFGPAPAAAETVVDLCGLSGVTLYEPEELVMTARPGTTLAEIRNVVAQRGQCLGFEPPEFGSLFGMPDRFSTLGGAVASGWAGPRRIRAGSVRDHVLGAIAVGGDGRIFRSGGRVVKNVTGFDLPKLLTGSHGTLAAMTEITIKVLPAPETSRTLAFLGLDESGAARLMSDALGGAYDVSGAAHLPAFAAMRLPVDRLAEAGAAVTLIRLEGFGPSVADRVTALSNRFVSVADSVVLQPDECRAAWAATRDVAPLIDPAATLWRLSLPPSDAPAVVARIRQSVPATALYDWGGGLVWLALPDSADGHQAIVRGALPSGHATLIRAGATTRARHFQPAPPALAALERRVKAAFDPNGILAPRLCRWEV